MFGVAWQKIIMVISMTQKVLIVDFDEFLKVCLIYQSMNLQKN